MGQQGQTLRGVIADVVAGRFFKGEITVRDGRITAIAEKDVAESVYILPGLIDAHIHIESSMLIPSEFARLAVVQGTVATVSDPHEIANVLGVEGIEFMIANGKKVPFKFFFGASSCVPATPFETAGASIGPREIDRLMSRPEIRYLSEMMNFPGVLNGDPEVMAKLEIARKYNKPVDGHAPGLSGTAARDYIAAGITTDHECFTLEEAREKIGYGMKVMIREGSAARNFDDLAPLITESPDMVMFCSDDRHPDDLVSKHMNDLVKRSLALGHSPMDVLRCCTLNPVRHYDLPVGLLQAGDPADLIVVDDLEHFNILATYIEGMKVAGAGKTLIDPVAELAPNIFRARPLEERDIQTIPDGRFVRLIEALEGQLITHEIKAEVPEGKPFQSDVERDILKIVVLSRYEPSPPAVGFIRSFGLKKGAIASTVAHDSHNLIAVGASDEEIVMAINSLITVRGGICGVKGEELLVLPLPVAGLMSNEDGYQVASAYDRLTRFAWGLGSPLRSPFMTLSFMALLVIPELKLSDRGLFDGKSFSFTSLFSS